MSIDLTKHHVPNTMLDKIAYYTVKSLRFPTDIFFQVRAPHRPPQPPDSSFRVFLVQPVSPKTARTAVSASLRVMAS